MRIDMPEEHQDRPFEHLAEHYAPEIVGPGAWYGTRAYQHSSMSLRELEAARYRTALINGCNVCKGFRGKRDFPGLFQAFDGDLETSVYNRGDAPDEDFYANIENWRDWPGYTDRERLIIRYAEGMGLAPQKIAQDEDFWEQAKATFTDEEIVDITYSIGAWMANGRAIHVLGLDTTCNFALPEAAE